MRIADMIDPGAAAEERRTVDDPCELDEAQLSPQDVLLLQACLRFVLKHQRDPSVSARLQQLADTLELRTSACGGKTPRDTPRSVHLPPGGLASVHDATPTTHPLNPTSPYRRDQVR
jgi:hypothetical protein